MSESIKRYVKWYKSKINKEVAQRYLDRLNLNNQDAIEKFEIAYCDGSYLKHIKRQSSAPLLYKNFKQSFAADGLLDGSHQVKFRSRLIFPLYGDDNSLKQVLGLVNT